MSTNDLHYPNLSPAIAVRNAAAAIEFYQQAFSATERYRLTDSSSGKIGHAELDVNGSVIMLSDENPDWNKSPQTLAGTTVKLCLMVANADETVKLATAAGATALMPVADQFYGFRSGTIRDPFGHEWLIQHEIEKVAPEEMKRRWDDMVNNCKPN